jgi:hypothetical protein
MSNVIIPESQEQNVVDLRSTRDQLFLLNNKARELRENIQNQIKFAFRSMTRCSFLFEEYPSRNTHDPAIDNDPSDDSQIIVYSYDNLYLLRDGSGWGTVDYSDRHRTLIPIPRSQWPMTPEAFKEKVLKATSHLELKVVFSTIDVRRHGGIENINALKLLHHDKIVEPVHRGEVWYVGWDISDPWYTATIDGFLWAFWHEGGHGGDIDKSAKAGTPEWERFQEFLKRDGT